MKKFYQFTVLFIFLSIMFGRETQLTAQVGRMINGPRPADFSNTVLTHDCCPEVRKKLDSIINNAPFVFEGRVIGGEIGGPHGSYLFEIEKVYRGGERLQAGTVEIIQRFVSYNSPFIALYNSWYILFAKEIDSSDIHFPYDFDKKDEFIKLMKDNFIKFDANNAIKLDLFHKEEYSISGRGIRIASYFTEDKDIIIDDKGELVGRKEESYYRSGFGNLNFKSKEEVRDFLAGYGLFPQEMPKADTLKTMSRRESEKARKKAIQETEERLRKEEDRKIHYKQLLETKCYLDSLSDKKTTRKEIENAMKNYENASDLERQKLLRNAILEEKQNIESLLDANSEKNVELQRFLNIFATEF